MIDYIKYLNSLSLITLANQIVRNVIATGDNVYLDSDRGFGRLYRWRIFKDAFEEAKLMRKPIFLLIHKPWCVACQQLKNKFSKSIKLIDLSKEFIMVNIENGEDPVGNPGKFQPDGKYVPRILFFTPDGELVKEVYNHHPKAIKKYKYFYSSPTQIIDSMLLVLKKYSQKEGVDTFKDDYVTRNSTDVPDDDITVPTLLE